MKKYYKIKLFTVLIFAGLLSACDLDINENPNSATSSVITPDLTFPAVVASTVYNQIYYGYAASAYFAGFQVPGSGVSGYGDQYTYNYTSSSVTGAWTYIFEGLRDYNTIIKKAEEDTKYALFGGISHILKAYSYQLLVDAYGDVPYSEALLGTDNYTPKYDKDSDVYQSLVAELDQAITIIKTNQDKVGDGVLALTGVNDPVFAGSLSKWIQFANNIKLRLLVRAQGSNIDSFVQDAFSKFSAEGFLKEDVFVDPGYNANSQQNPYWTLYHSSVAGVAPQSAQYFIPSKYVFSFYNGAKLTDNFRGALVYKGFPNTPSGRLADETNNPASTRAIWFIGTGTGTASSDAKGILKSRSAPAPLFFAANIYFLLAEAALTGHALDGDVKTNFEKGITASFAFLALSGTSTTLSNVSADVQTYLNDNAGNYLVNIDLADSNEKKLEAIITQKYIALNILDSNEAWNEFKRTAYPKISSGTDPIYTFVSIDSQSTHADGLPVRLVYPQSEYNLNGDNVPKITNAYSNPIFWDKD
ncbi:MAG: SusD/RagB family nutrient-binding outer membrane lipoprotein [Dysgonamonadaceae bacterium]|jgi:hypothetical protein|nr:SusD/RagB family nutrient-binding outer membrane lipoprotein [Dysgonamonadaceae bacterium]